MPLQPPWFNSESLSTTSLPSFSLPHRGPTGELSESVPHLTRTKGKQGEAAAGPPTPKHNTYLWRCSSCAPSVPGCYWQVGTHRWTSGVKANCLRLKKHWKKRSRRISEGTSFPLLLDSRRRSPLESHPWPLSASSLLPRKWGADLMLNCGKNTDEAPYSFPPLCSFWPAEHTSSSLPSWGKGGSPCQRDIHLSHPVTGCQPNEVEKYQRITRGPKLCSPIFILSSISISLNPVSLLIWISTGTGNKVLFNSCLKSL